MIIVIVVIVIVIILIISHKLEMLSKKLKTLNAGLKAYVEIEKVLKCSLYSTDRKKITEIKLILKKTDEKIKDAVKLKNK